MFQNLLNLILPVKLVWVCLIFILRKIWKGKNNYEGISHKEWWKFGMMPLFTATAMLLMYYCYSSDKKVQASYLFFTVGLIVMNFLVMELMQDILEKGELLRESALTDQKKESQLAYYRDMQTVYERQGRKMHDYKNQIRTIQVLIKEGNPQAAATLAEKLTENIWVEMSAVNTNHPVVEKVQITDGIVLDSNGGMHGIGLSNVKAVVDKYGGDFVISCDSEKFQAVVML